MKMTRLEEGECITLYDVSSLFTSIPVTSAIEIKIAAQQDSQSVQTVFLSYIGNIQVHQEGHVHLCK